MTNTVALTCSFITINTVYFDSVPHTPFCCQEYSIEHQMWINPLLKIVQTNTLLPKLKNEITNFLKFSYIQY